MLSVAPGNLKFICQSIYFLFTVFAAFTFVKVELDTQNRKIFWYHLQAQTRAKSRLQKLGLHLLDSCEKPDSMLLLNAKLSKQIHILNDKFTSAAAEHIITL